jgi:hypothetical protein
VGQPCSKCRYRSLDCALDRRVVRAVRLLGVEQIGKFAVRGETMDFTEEIAGLGELRGSGGSTGRLYMSPKRDRPTRTRLLEVPAGSRTGAAA